MNHSGGVRKIADRIKATFQDYDTLTRAGVCEMARQNVADGLFGSSEPWCRATGHTDDWSARLLNHTIRGAKHWDFGVGDGWYERCYGRDDQPIRVDVRAFHGTVTCRVRSGGATAGIQRPGPAARSPSRPPDPSVPCRRC